MHTYRELTIILQWKVRINPITADTAHPCRQEYYVLQIKAIQTT